MDRLEDQVAVVAGGGRGIGRAIAVAMAGEGARVVVSSRTRAELDWTVAECKALGVDALAVEALKLFQQFKISDLFALDARGRPAGYIDVQDLPKLKIL